MPDMATHLLAQVAINSVFVKSRSFGNAALVGTVIPDLMNVVKRSVQPPYNWWVYPMHSPIFLVVLIYSIGMFFHEDDRPMMFGGLLAGAFIHLCLDMMQDSLASTLSPFFPLSFKTYTLRLFAPEASLQWLPVTIIVTVAFVWIGRILSRGEKTSEGVTNGQ